MTRHKIADAAVAVLAEHGLAALTHRLVARRAGVSLAATTYYYETKFDIVADASHQILSGYVEAFRRVATRYRDNPQLSPGFRGFAVRLAANAADKNRLGTTAWCEIILDAARHSETRTLARMWFAELGAVWREIAKVMDVTAPQDIVLPAVETVIGLFFMVISLGLSEAQVEAVLMHGADPREAWHCAHRALTNCPESGGKSRKAAETRERILVAAIDILSAEGAAAVTYRAVAAKAGLTVAAPAYHFPTIDSLLNAAQARLFESSKDRYRMVMAGVDFELLDVERLVDLTAAVFLREATEYGAPNRASYSIWMEASRQVEVRPMVWSAIEDQYTAWHRLLDTLMPTQRPLDALLIQCLFVGKLIRVLATGAITADLALVRSQFARDLRAIVEARFCL